MLPQVLHLDGGQTARRPLLVLEAKGNQHVRPSDAAVVPAA